MPSLHIREKVSPLSPVPLSPSGNNTISQYTYGLNGVSIFGDNVSSRILYGTIGLICIIVTVVQISHKVIAHCRHLSSLSADQRTQAYWRTESTTWWPWLKRNLLYAPFRHKRHNREIKLSTAVNVGVIPGRLHSILLIFYCLSNMTYMLALNYKREDRAETIAELRGRSGHLAVLNMIVLFLFAGRNNPFIAILNVSFDTFNLFHRWIGRIIISEAIIHTIAWMANKVAASGWASLWHSLSKQFFLQTGMVATLAMCIILFQSPSAVRHAFYETFLACHQFLAFTCLIGTLLHATSGPLPQVKYMILICCIWFYDRVFRLLRLVYRNFAKGGRTRVTVEALPGDACRVTFHMPRVWRPAPGTHIYAYLPGVSYWQSHPFSIAWTKQITEQKHDEYSSGSEKGLIRSRAIRTDVSLICQAQTGMTRKLYERAAAAPQSRLHISGFLEGAYGTHESLASYGTVLLFAGGVGITHQLRLVRDLLEKYADGTVAARRCTLVWTVREAKQLEWIRPWMDEILSMPGRRDLLRVQLFVTKPRSPADIQSPSERVQMFAGRPKAGLIIRKEFDERVGAMTVGVCGPGALADDVRAGAREVVEEGKCDFWEEAFTW